MVVEQGEVWWVDLGEPIRSEPGYRRPVVVVQSNAFNASRLGTIVCVALTGQVRWANAPGNVLLAARSTGLDRDSVANVSQIVTVDRESLSERAGKIGGRDLARIVDGIVLLLGQASISQTGG